MNVSALMPTTTHTHPYGRLDQALKDAEEAYRAANRRILRQLEHSPMLAIRGADEALRAAAALEVWRELAIAALGSRMATPPPEPAEAAAQLLRLVAILRDRIRSAPYPERLTYSPRDGVGMLRTAGNLIAEAAKLEALDKAEDVLNGIAASAAA